MQTTRTDPAFKSPHAPRRLGTADRITGGKLVTFIEAHGHKPAVAFAIAQRESGLDLMDSTKVGEPRSIDGMLVAKTWTKTKSGMLWCYLLDETGVLYSFPVFNSQSVFNRMTDTPLGSEISACFTASKRGVLYCTSLAVRDRNYMHSG